MSNAGRTEASTGHLVWVSPEPSPDTVEELIRRFPEVIKLPEDEIKAKSDEWRATGLVARSLGRKISAEAAVRELRLRGGLKGEVTGYSLDEGFMLLRFKEPGDRDRVLERPWVVNGHALAIEPWRPWFIPAATAIQTAVVWMRLPLLPVELWGRESLRRIATWAGELVTLDECTSQRRRLGFARVAVRIHLSRPLRPGVLVGGPDGNLWQRFVYENLAGVCLGCGMFHLTGNVCQAAGDGGPAKLHPENVDTTTEQRGEESTGEPGLGPWLLAVRRWLPPEQRSGTAGKKGSAREKPYGNSQMKGKQPLGAGETGTGRPLDGDGWSKPDKVARRRSPPRFLMSLEGGESESRPGLKRAHQGSDFGPLQEEGDVGTEVLAEKPVRCSMERPAQVRDEPIRLLSRESGHPKRARSPTKSSAQVGRERRVPKPPAK